MGNVVISTFVAGVVGTGIGGVLGVLISTRKKRLIDSVVAFAGGIMLAIVFFDLLPSALEIYPDPMVSLIGFVWGIVVMCCLGWLVRYVDTKTIVSVNAFMENKNYISKEQKIILKRSGVFLFIAIALHNVPEGLAVGASSAVDMDIGFAMAAVICLHNIPEGLAVSLPMSVSGTNKIISVLLTFFVGGMTIVGGMVGHYVGRLSAMATAFSLAFAGGAMLNVVMKEMVCKESGSADRCAPVEWLLIGVIVGFLFTIAI